MAAYYARSGSNVNFVFWATWAGAGRRQAELTAKGQADAGRHSLDGCAAALNQKVTIATPTPHCFSDLLILQGV